MISLLQRWLFSFLKSELKVKARQTNDVGNTMISLADVEKEHQPEFSNFAWIISRELKLVVILLSLGSTRLARKITIQSPRLVLFVRGTHKGEAKRKYQLKTKTHRETTPWVCFVEQSIPWPLQYNWSRSYTQPYFITITPTKIEYG